LVQARNTLLQRAQRLQVHGQASGTFVRLVPRWEAAGKSGDGWGEGCVARLALHNECLQVVVSAAEAERWLCAQYPQLKLPPLPPEFVRASILAVMEQLLDALQGTALGLVPVLDGQDTPDAPPSVLYTVNVSLWRSHRWVCSGRILTSEAGLQALAAGVAAHAQAHNALALDALPLAMPLVMGYSVMRVSVLRTLQVGDVVLVDRALASPEGALWLGCGGWGVQVRWDEGRWRVNQACKEMESHMKYTELRPGSQDPGYDFDSELHSDLQSPSEYGLEGDLQHRPGQDALGDGQRLADWQDIAVRVSFDLGSCTMTLAQLQTLQRGQTLELGTGRTHAVSVRANGALIGQGELMEVDGRLGVMLIALKGDGSTGAP
jgi:type III secretion protein Q